MSAELPMPRAVHGLRVDRILVIVNGRAGGVKRRPGLVATLRREVRGRGEVVVTETADQLTHALRRARALGVDTIGICGGDGTNVTTLTALSQVYGPAPWPRITLLAGGTMNTSAANFASAGPAGRQLRSLLDSEEPRVRRLPLLQVGERVGFIFGAQMVARILDLYYAGPVGPLGSALRAVQIVGSGLVGGPLLKSLLQPEPVDIEIDGERFGWQPLSAVLAAVVPNIGIGMRALPRAGEDGAFQLVATGASPWQLVRQASHLWAGLPFDAMNIDRTGYRARLRFETERPYTIDGDLFSAREVELGLTAPVELIAPAWR